MDAVLKDRFSSLLGSPIIKATAISGGDISQAYLLQTQSENFFCKINTQPEAYTMFQSEADGLIAIRETKTLKTPEVFHIETWRQGAFLIMEHIASKRPVESEMKTFGRQLAQLHMHGDAFFGWKADNFIGSLPQFNKKHKSWSNFYVLERLQPQLKMARDNGHLLSTEVPSQTKMLQVIEELDYGIKPSLVHGDLWGGNFLVSHEGNPYLIDPAIFFGHGEVDIAMSQLFGGFGDAFYKAYEEIIPGDPKSADRIKLYQLYYLLVHLNLFGRSYYSSVNTILKSYF